MSPQYSRVETEEWSAEVHGHIIERIILSFGALELLYTLTYTTYPHSELLIELC